MRTKERTCVTGARPSEDIRVSVFVCVHLLNIMVCVYNKMSIQVTLPSDLLTRVSAMATDKKPRVSEAYSFQEFPLKKLGLKKPEFVTKSVFSIPELKDTPRMPFVCLTPTAGEWLRVCFDVDTNHASTLKDDKGVPVAFKLVIDVKDKQEEFMLKLDKRLRELSALDTKIDWLPILMEKAEHASSFSIKVSMRNTCIKIYDGKDLRDGKGWEFVKDLSFQNARAKVAFAPVRVWEKDGKAGVALEATELVIQEGEIRTKMADCFTVDKL